jgi:hypothetical protein
MKLLEPTQKFLDAFPDGHIAKNHKFWFNIDLVFMATKTSTEEIRKQDFKMYSNVFGIDMTYETLMENFNVPFSEFIQEFKDVPEIYNSFNFNL